ncbi:hypothetical protein DQ04_03151060 [Trypanosoma grayi]|uniref:hypothetical protein n=1 Tax=Trypanosoma grayi TaxID=71804 RepID=UPI0004F3F62B|nr:hypothetical protein DQ04_03151060 [Trypanosoma grayi]KEG10921.1 hypothetical protein DQ04_03151060 [Trypanosoma grayi]
MSMHKNTLPVSSYMGISVLLLGLLLSGSLSPLARKEHDGRSLKVFGFLIECEKSPTSQDSSSADDDSDTMSPPVLARGSKKPLTRLYVADLPPGSLRSCIIANIFLTCFCAILAIALIVVAFLATVHPAILRPAHSRRMAILLCLAIVVLGRFVLVVVMVARGELYADIEGCNFAQSTALHLHSGFVVSLVSVIICIVAVIALWNTNYS